MESIPPGAARIVGTAVLEVWVHASLLRGKASCRVILEKTIQEIEASFFETRHKTGGVLALPLGERVFVVGE